MKKNRMVAGIVLTTGLGLTGVVAASPSGAATPEQAKTSAASASGSASGSASAVAIGSTHKGGGVVVMCVSKVTLPGKPVPGRPLPGKPLPGKPLPGKPGEIEKAGGKVIIKVVHGKVYVNGKLVPKAKLPKCPPLPPLPGKGKGVVCVVEKGWGKPGHGKTTVKVVDGKVYLNGKLVPKAKLPKCPPPPFPGEGNGKGHGGVVVQPGTGTVLGFTNGLEPAAPVAAALAG